MATFANLNRRTAVLAVGLAATPGAGAPVGRRAAVPHQACAHHHPFPVAAAPMAWRRPVADKLSKTWGQSVVVETAPAATASLRSMPSKRGAKDGHDLIVLDNVHLAAYPSLFKKLPYDTAKDFDTLLPLFQHLLLLHRGHQQPYKTVADVVADAKARPGKLQPRLVVGGQPGAPGLGAVREHDRHADGACDLLARPRSSTPRFPQATSTLRWAVPPPQARCTARWQAAPAGPGRAPALARASRRAHRGRIRWPQWTCRDRWTPLPLPPGLVPPPPPTRSWRYR